MISDYSKSTDYSGYRPSGYPVKHKRKVPFEPTIKLELEYRRLLSDIREMDKRLEEIILTAGDYADFINDVHASNIHWSTKIEGNPLSQEEVKRISTSFFHGNINEKNSGPIQEVLNHLYSHLVRDMFRLPWDMDVVKKTHKILTSDTGISEIPGELRTHRSVITGTDGFEYMHPCPPEHVEEELGTLTGWINTSPFDEIVTATLFFHEFESIHPFTDGNGRTGRTLFQILLQELGLKNSKLCRFEEEVLGSITIYYNLLGYTDQTSDYAPLIMYITESLHNAYSKAVEEFGSRNVLKDMDEVSRILAVRSKGISWFSINDASGWVNLGNQSVRNKLNELVDLGVLEKAGRTNGMRFRFKDPFADMKRTAEAL